MYKTGSTVKTALTLFNHFNKTIVPEKIKQVESEWLQKSSYAALTWANKYEGPAYAYDICSHYPALMSHKLMFFPIKEGTFHKIIDDDIKERVPYGIYRCVIDIDENAKQLFRYNQFNYYTHIDIQVAKELGLKITMIQDDQPNQLF